MIDQQAEMQGLVNDLETHSDHFGPFHPRTVAVANRLALALWSVGEVQRAVSLLDQALNGLASVRELDHPVRIEVLSTLGDIFVGQSLWEPASGVYREILEYCVRRSGEHDASSLAAKGDLAIALFELGKKSEAVALEAQALESARCHLGKMHPVTCILAWNIVLRHESAGDGDSARRIVLDDLSWLLAQDQAVLDDDQRIIQKLLASRLQWDTAAAC